MAQTDLENPRTGQWTSTLLSAANTANTVTCAAPPNAGTVVRIHKIVVSSSVEANTAGTLTIKPDNSTSPIVIDLDQKLGIVGQFDFDPPIYGLDKTAVPIVASAFTGATSASKSRVTVVYDYKDQNARKV